MNQKFYVGNVSPQRKLQGAVPLKLKKWKC